jgi:hypothetical protein
MYRCRDIVIDIEFRHQPDEVESMLDRRLKAAQSDSACLASDVAQNALKHADAGRGYVGQLAQIENQAQRVS